METLDEVMEAAKGKWEKEQAKIATEYAIRSSITEKCPTLLAPRSVFVHTLYGEQASVTWEGRAYDPEGISRPTVDTVKELVAAFPPLSIVKVNTGCVSFRSEVYDENHPEKTGTREPAGTIRLKVCGQYCKATVEWLSVIEGVGVVRFDVVLPWTQAMGILKATRIEFRGGYRYESRRCIPSPVLNFLPNGLGAAQVVTWWSSPEWAGDFTITWVPNEDGLGWEVRHAEAITEALRLTA